MAPLLEPSNTSADERYRLATFRRAARSVIRAYRPYKDITLRVTLGAKEPPQPDLIPWSEFRSLCLALRLIYMNSEPAHIDEVLKIAERVPETRVAELCARIREDWTRALTGRIHMELYGESYSPERVLKTWFYALTFHQDKPKQEAAEQLRSAEPIPTFALQWCVLHLCVCVLNLDNLVAHLLDEPPMPPPEQADPAPPFAFA